MKKRKFLLISTAILLSVMYVCVCSIATSIYAEDTSIYYNSVHQSAIRNTYDEIFSYSRKEIVEDVSLTMATPAYYNQNTSLSNECAAVAGGVLIGYFDRIKENLIPNFSPVIKRGPVEIYKPMTSNIQQVIESLFVGMNTNAVQPGATKNDFETGLTSYVVGKGYTIDYQSNASGSAVDWSFIKESFLQQYPVAVFAAPAYIVTSLEIGDTSTSIQTLTYSTNHIMVGYGMMEVRYFNGMSLVRTDRYLKISSGLINSPYAYLQVNSAVTVHDITSVSIS